jgi:uncharacterized protein YdbL (DUF1318 family)
MLRLLALAGLSLLAASAAPAQTPAVDQAKAGGQVGERYDGYLGLVTNVPATVRSQVSAINVRRRTLYSNFAATHRVSPREVGITAGCQLLGRVGVGEAYLLPDNVWRRRAPGQAPSLPDYCR